MFNSSIVDTVTKRFIAENLENSTKISYTELSEKDGLVKILYEDLPTTDVKGYPVASDFVTSDGKAYSVDDYADLSPEEKKRCKLRYYYLPYTHELYIGSTGSGKTTGCVEPQLRAISTQKNKPNLFVTDPKGELFNHNAKYLKDNGYRLFVVNFKDLYHSDKWNPLYEIYDTAMEIKNAGKDCIAHLGQVKEGLRLIQPIEAFSDRGYVEYKGIAFPDALTAENYIETEKDFLTARLDSEIGQLSHIMIPAVSMKDPSWEYGAQELLQGVLHCMVEDAINEEETGFTREMMTFRTLQQYYWRLKRAAFDDGLRNSPLIKDKKPSTVALMSTALENATTTMKSYCGVFDGATKDWFLGHILALTTGNTVSIDDDKPFAIFLITRDYEKSDFTIAGLFVDWVYRKLLEKAERGDKTRTMHFLLDEFGNIPKIKDFENKIATARSRDIWFHLALQSYSQLNGVYNNDNAEIIKDNCAQIFLGSTNSATKETFSRACGKHNVPSLESRINPNDNSICEVALIPVSALNEITPGQIYMLRDRMPVISSQFIRSYICAEQGIFGDMLTADGLISCAPLSLEPFTGDKYTYKRIAFDNNDNDDDLF